MFGTGDTKPVSTFVEISADNNDLNEETIDGKNATQRQECYACHYNADLSEENV